MTTGRGRLHLKKTTRSERPPAREDTTITSGGVQKRAELAAKSIALTLDERFLCEDEVGRGGMGSIYGVYERSLGRRVALKVLHERKVGDELSRRRFLAEAQITGQLEHPNIVPVYEVGEDDTGRTFFTMRLIEGDTFTDTLSEGPMKGDALESAMDVYLRVCDALAFAHTRGVLHRDIKPSNIMVGEHGQVYLVDWGVAMISEKALSGDDEGPTTTLSIPTFSDEGMIVGTYAYMSPEQARGDTLSVDRRTDVFGMGAVLYRIVTGSPPFRAAKAEEALRRAARSEVPEIRVDDPLGNALMQLALQAMQREQDNRFQNIDALKRAVQTTLRGRRRFPTERVDVGTVLVREGEQGDTAYFIRSGEFTVYREEKGRKVLLNRLGPGDVFGEAAVFTNNPRSASVKCEKAAEVVVVTGDVLNSALSLDSWMGAFVRAQGARFDERSKRVIALETQLQNATTMMRVLQHFLKNTCDEMAIDDVASALCLTRQDIVTAVNESGVLEVDGGLICRV